MLRFGYAAILISVLSVSLSSMEARAQEAKPRFVVIIDEMVEGKPATVHNVQGAIETGLVQHGYKVVSSKQVVEARAETSVNLLMEGKLSERITSLEADFLIAGSIDATRLGQIEGTSFVVFLAGVKTSVVRIDTGEIVASFMHEVRGDGITEKASARRTLKNAGSKVLDDILEKIPELKLSAKQIELVIHGIPDRTRIEEVHAQLKNISDIKKAAVRHSSVKLTKFDLDSKVGSEKLSSVLNADKRLPVEIISTSQGSILARYNAARTLHLGLLVTQPVNRLGKRYDWINAALPEILAAELQNVEYLKVATPDQPVPAPRGKLGRSKIKKLSKAHGDVPLVAIVKAMPAGKKATLSLKIYEALGGQVLFTASASGDPDDLPPVVGKLAGKVGDKLLPSIAKHKRLAKLEQFAGAIGVAKSKKKKPEAVLEPKISIKSVELENLFPSRFGYYQNNTVGEVSLQVKKASESEKPSDVKVSVFVPGFMKLPSEVALGKLEENDEVKVPIRMTLDADKIFTVDDNRPAQASVRVAYRSGGGVMEASRVVPLIVFDRNAIDWSASDSIAAFVTNREESVKKLARKVIAARSDDSPPAMFEAMAMFNALKQLKMKYQKDPVSPFRSRTLDYVQYPRETLGYRTGDCDDLAVLYTALLESVGVQTAFITTPGHILAAFRLEPGDGQLMNLAPEPDMMLVTEATPAGQDEAKSGTRGTSFRIDATKDKGNLVRTNTLKPNQAIWIPVETTALNKSFMDAWRRGAREANKFKAKPGKLALIPVHQAWTSYPAVSLPREVKDVPLDQAALKRQLEEDSKEFMGDIKASHKKRLAALKKKVTKSKKNLELKNDYAVLLACSGQLDEAASQLSSAVEADPKHACSLNNLGNVHLLRGEFKKSVERYEQALRSDPNCSDRVLANLGLAYYSYGELSKAKQAFSECARLGGQELFTNMGLTPPREAKGLVGKDKQKRPKEVIERDLKNILEEVLSKQLDQKAKKDEKKKPAKTDLFSNPLPSGGRRGDDPASRRRLVGLLRWF